MIVCEGRRIGGPCRVLDFVARVGCEFFLKCLWFRRDQTTENIWCEMGGSGCWWVVVWQHGPSPRTFLPSADNRIIEESYQREMMEKESQEGETPVRPRRRQRHQLNEPMGACGWG